MSTWTRSRPHISYFLARYGFLPRFWEHSFYTDGSAVLLPLLVTMRRGFILPIHANLFLDLFFSIPIIRYLSAAEPLMIFISLLNSTLSLSGLNFTQIMCSLFLIYKSQSLAIYEHEPGRKPTFITSISFYSVYRTQTPITSVTFHWIYN